MIPILSPPFHRSRPNPGYIQGYLKGVRENGGQYTHGAIWAIYAFCMLKNYEDAYRIFDMLNPISHTEKAHDVEKYKLEPYVVCADIYYNNLQRGRGGWSFYTGSAAWLYRAGLEELLGFDKQGSRLFIEPSVPEGFQRYSIEYTYGKTKYIIHVERQKEKTGKKITVDGVDKGIRFIELVDDGKDKIVNVMI